MVVAWHVQGGAHGAKLSHRGLVLAGKVWASWLLGRGYPNGVGYIRFGWQGDMIQQCMKGAWMGPKTKT